MKKAVTIKTIAEELNLSRNTVSKALNGQYVPQKTRELVLKKAQELNYKSLNSANLKINRKYRIMLVSARPLNDINFYTTLISSIENYCFERNFELIQYLFNSKLNTFNKLSDYIEKIKIDGIIAMECFDKSFIQQLLKLDIPICFHDFAHTSSAFSQSFDIICTNDEQSICNFVKYLHKKHKFTKFSFVGDSRHCHSFGKRYTGMLLGLRNLKISHTPIEDINIPEHSFNYGDIIALKKEIEKLQILPEVFICCNDFVARNVCLALESMNVRVPKDAFVVGFDNALESYSLLPKLTTFSLNKQFLGSEILKNLIQRIEDTTIPSRLVTISTDLILRDSTQIESL